MFRNPLLSYLLVLFFSLSINSCGPGPQKDQAPKIGQAKKASNKTSPKENVARILASNSASINGKKVYSVSCLLCHGKNGDQKANNAMDLTTSTLSLEDRINVIAHGRKQMTSFQDKLRDEEIKAVAEYVATLRK